MSSTIETEALLLGRVLYGERDIVLTLLTRDAGLVQALARGARGSRKRFGEALDLFVVFAGRLVSRQGAGLWSLVEAEPVRQFPRILESLERLEAGQEAIVVARDLLRDAPAGRSAWDHVLSGFSRLDASPDGLAHRAVLTLCLDLVADLGHPLAGTICPDCRRPYPEGERRILSGNGGLLCTACGAGPGGVSIPERLARVLETGGDAADRTDVTELVAAIRAAILPRGAAPTS